MSEAAVRPRLFAHFLPKFDNEGTESRLAHHPDAQAHANCLAVSKKHSGHLVMCPPFYSKNGSGNSYSRIGELLLRRHFAAVWPEAPGAFDEWWAHAAAHGLCYCFECVVPRVLGDHGATPHAAYMVLTTVSHTASAGFLSPAEVLRLGALWRLPLNEAWFVPWEAAGAVEDALHAARWTLRDSDVEALLASTLGGAAQAGAAQSGAEAAPPLATAVHQHFLRHGETQGEVLEGFVLMALDVTVGALWPLLQAYEAAVKPHRAAALVAALASGRECMAGEDSAARRLVSVRLQPPQGGAGWLRIDATGPSLLQALELPGPREPVRQQGPSSAARQEEAWRLACGDEGAEGTGGAEEGAGGEVGSGVGGGGGGGGGSGGAAALHLLFRTLRTLYSRRVTLKLSVYEGRQQLQVDVHDDQIFFSWPLHMATSGVAPLFRGMVVQFDAATPRPLCDALRGGGGGGGGDGNGGGELGGGGGGEVLPVRVLAIGKLKCLHYLVRTFGVRNLLPTLLESGREAYLHRVERFFSNWQLPPEQRQRLATVLAGWATEVSYLSPPELARLKGGSYLEFIEPYLAGERRAREQVPAALAPLRAFGLLLLNLSGAPLPDALKKRCAAAHDEREAKGVRGPMPGCYMELTRPPNDKVLAVGSPPLVVVIASPPSDAEPKLCKMFERCAALGTTHPHVHGRVLLDPTEESWAALLQGLSPAAEGEEEGGGGAGAAALAPAAVPAAAAAPAPVVEVRTVTVIAALALPPGGGKSTLFAALQQLGAAVVSSDAIRARKLPASAFDVEMERALRRHAVVCYDKNVPNPEGLAKLVRTLTAVSRQQPAEQRSQQRSQPAEVRSRLELRLLLVVPSRLEHDVAWARVEKRPRTDVALNVHTVRGGTKEAYHIFHNIFFGPCLALLPLAQRLPGALTSDAFWRGGAAAQQLAAQLMQTARDGAAAPLEAVAAAIAAGGEAGGPGGGDGAGGGAGAVRAHWASLEIPGTKLHLTLVPPRLEEPSSPAEAFSTAPPPADDRGDERARAQAARCLVPLRGQWARVALAHYHLAASRDGTKQVGLWEVRAVDGLPAEAQWAPQRTYYHVTDKASLVGCNAAAAFEVLRALRRGNLHPDWRITTLPMQPGHEPLSVAGEVKVHG